MAVFEDKYKPDMEVSLGFLNLRVSSLSNLHVQKSLGGLKLSNKGKAALVLLHLKCINVSLLQSYKSDG